MSGTYVHGITRFSKFVTDVFFFRILSSTVLLYSAISGKLINLEEDELEFYIGEEDTYDDSNYTFMAELKSADK